MYPRRPKPLKNNNELIEIKIHGIVSSEAARLQEHGISIFAGTSLTNKFESINDNENMLWFSLVKSQYYSTWFDDIEIIFDKREIITSGNGIISILTQEDVIKLVENSKEYTWNEILKFLEEWRVSSPWRRGLYTTRFKPVFLLYVVD